MREGRERSRRALRRGCGAVVRDAAEAAQARLVELLVAPEDGAGWECAAFAAPGLDRPRRAELARELARSSARSKLPEPHRRTPLRLGACDAELARCLEARRPRLLRQAFVPVGGTSAVSGWLRIVAEEPPSRATLRLYRALARQAAGRLEAESLRDELAARHRGASREASRRQRAAEALGQAKDVLAALNLAGTRLMVETDGAAIQAVICNELVRLGFHSAVLAIPAGASPGGAPMPLGFAATSFHAPLQRATERVLGKRLDELRVDPAGAPLVARVLRAGRTVYTARAKEVARQIFGGASDARVRRLDRLLGLRHVVLAPLRYGGGVSGLLVVASPRLRRADPAAIDAFALQASIALEKARLFAELRGHQARLASQVEARTADLTRAVEALREADRRKDNFLANVSHELRTPLVTVMGYTDLLLSGKLGELGPRPRECLQVVASSARRLRSFIDELLELSRYELTRDRLSLERFDPRELVAQAALAIAPRFGERHISLRARVGPGAPAGWGDRERLLQVLAILLSNAGKHCAEGTQVRVAAAGSREGGLLLAVRDDGPGIAPEHLERIFERLYQVGDAAPRREGAAGLGLGLSIAKGIVEAHGGTIAVRSRMGHGTCFRVSLPPPAGA